MMTFKKILLATDFSPESEKACSVAEKIATAFGGKIDLLHVIPTVKYLSESVKKLGLPLSVEQDIFPKIIDESEEMLNKIMSTSISAPHRGEYFVKIDRKPSATIADHAAENGYDLIVMGSRGKDESSTLRGGTTERVIRKSPVAVLSVDQWFDEEMINNILVPTDASPLSYSAFPIAALLAGTFGSALTLFYVQELYGTISDELADMPGDEEKLSIYDALVSRLGDYLKKHGAGQIELEQSNNAFENIVNVHSGNSIQKIPVYTKIGHGISAHYEIERLADQQADMVVMATHGHSGLSHLLLGSTAEKVTQNIDKPVLTVRPDKSLFES